jgi:predicted nucleotidyltransferase
MAKGIKNIPKNVFVFTESLKKFEGIDSVYLFGSYVRNEATVSSDIDIAIVLTPPSSSGLRGRVRTELNTSEDGHLDIQLTYVDANSLISDMNELNIAQTIRKEGVLLWRR